MALHATMRRWNRSSGSTCIGCPSTLTEYFDWSVVTWSLRLNVYCATGMPVIESIIFCPISFARHTSTSPVALTLVMMFLRDVLSANEFLSDIVRSRVWVSIMSRRCRDLRVSLFWPLVLYLAPLNSCIAVFTSAHAGIASNHVRCCCSVIPLPLVRPPLIFMLRISTCSIIRSVDKLAHARLLLLATCSPSTKCWCTTGWSLGKLAMELR